MRKSPVLPDNFPGEVSILRALFSNKPADAPGAAGGRAFAEMLQDIRSVGPEADDQFLFQSGVGPADDGPEIDLPGTMPELPGAAAGPAALGGTDVEPGPDGGNAGTDAFDLI